MKTIWRFEEHSTFGGVSIATDEMNDNYYPPVGGPWAFTKKEAAEIFCDAQNKIINDAQIEVARAKHLRRMALNMIGAAD